MDENSETIQTWKIITWLGIGFFSAIVIWFIIDTCYDIHKTETEEEEIRRSAMSHRRSCSKFDSQSGCYTPKLRHQV